MKKLSLILLISFYFSSSYGQMAEIGYNTTDVGAEFQWYKDGQYIGLHLAANAKLHHSFHGSIGYYIAGNPTSSIYNNQNNGGLGLGIGYRYYFLLRPRAFFIGVNANLFTHKITVNAQGMPGRTSKIFIPAFQTGYMFLINDMFFITPVVSFGYKTNFDSLLKGDNNNAVALIGISAGIKF